ncbi:MAG: hypothetical protein IJ745_03965 [Bacteroidales bacterium]|nr:hypothetical protein [Bacteroidales bacterium]
MYKEETNRIKRSAQWGLWGSVAAAIAASLFLYAGRWEFLPQSEYVTRWMLVAGCVLAVLSVSMVLLVLRKRIPNLKYKEEGLQAKLAGYGDLIRSVYMTVLGEVVFLCVLTVLSAQTVLLMLAMVSVLTLVLAYPNIYKVKVDLGLTDEEMKSLYGDQYIAESKDGQ